MIELLPPAVILILGGLALPLIPAGHLRELVIVAVPALTLVQIWAIPEGTVLELSFLAYTLAPVESTVLGRLFATVFALMALAGGIYALRQSKIAEISAAFVYAGSAVGVTFAGDLITVFLFWEVMAIASTVVLWMAGTERSGRAAMRYALMHLFGGVVLMIGIIAYIHSTGSVAFEPMQLGEPATWLILAGFLINAGAPPFSAWLPDAYPEGSPAGMVFLSAFTTKAAVYVLIRGFPGTELLVFIGLFMVFYGIIYALLENDMRRILAYSIVNQVGFMVTGVGIGTDMAINGAAAHAFTHIIYKALLLMSAGSVLTMTGERRCTHLGGLFRTMPLTTVCGIIGAISISSFPLTSGFISKSMISQASIDEHMMLVWLLLAAASAGVFLHAGIKFPWFVFFQKDSGLRPSEPPWNMRAAMVLFAALCILIGCFPGTLYALLPFPVEYKPYTAVHVLEILQLLLFSGLAFFICLPLMRRTLTISLDVDWFYRKLFGPGGRMLAGWTSRALDAAGQSSLRVWTGFLALAVRSYGPNAALGRSQDVGAAMLWIMVVLGLCLALYYYL